MFSFTKEAYASKDWAFVSDVARLYTIYKNGGIYLDIDVELIGSLVSLRHHSSFLGEEK